MVSEGVDIPRLRVGVYATAAKTALIFRQIVGRFVRVIPGRPVEPSWLYLPGDPVLRGHAADVERELLHVLAPAGRGGPARRAAGPHARPSRAETPRLRPAVAPTSRRRWRCSAAGRRRPRRAAPRPPSPSRAEPEPAVSAFERRKRLREDRRRLVSDLGRKQGRPPAEINAWVNGEVGVPRVQDATIEQLERSIDLLFEELRSRTFGGVEAIGRQRVLSRFDRSSFLRRSHLVARRSR